MRDASSTRSAALLLALRTVAKPGLEFMQVPFLAWPGESVSEAQDASNEDSQQSDSTKKLLHTLLGNMNSCQR
jgi:hypothetical protein